MEVKVSGDPMTILVLEGGRTWHNLFFLIPDLLADSPPPVTHRSKKPSSFGLPTHCSIAGIPFITYKIPPPTPQAEIQFKHHDLSKLPLVANGLSIRAQEEIRTGKARVASKAIETIFVKDTLQECNLLLSHTRFPEGDQVILRVQGAEVSIEISTRDIVKMRD